MRRKIFPVSAALLLVGCYQAHELDGEPLDAFAPRLDGGWLLEDCVVGATCTSEFGARVPSHSFRETATHLRGTWRLCGERSETAGHLFVDDLVYDGLEIGLGGRFRFLRSGDDGTLVPLSGLDHEGVLEEGLNGPDSVFVVIDNGVRPQAIVRMSECPRKLRLRFLANGPVLEYVASE